MSDEVFVRAWVGAYRMKWGLKKMCHIHSLDYVAASQRASRLRRAGVKLPTMQKAGQKNNILETDVKALNKIVVDTLGKDALSYRTR